MVTVVYPFHDSLLGTLGSADSPLIVMRLLRRIMFDLGVTDVEAEMLLGLATKYDHASFDDICEIIPHFIEDRVKRLIKRMVQSGLVDTQSSDDDHGLSYTIKPSIFTRIKSFDKASLS